MVAPNAREPRRWTLGGGWSILKAVVRPRWLTPALALIVGACAPPPPPPVGRPPAPALTAESRAALTLAETPVNVPAEVSVTDDTARYPVIGSTAAEIRTQLRLDRYDIADSEFVGLTRAEVQWQFRLQHVDSGGCALAQIAVFLHFETLLPQWLPPNGRPTVLADQWQKFLSATEIHEMGHRNIALHTATAIDHLLHAVHAPACPGLRDVANLNARAEWDLGDRRQRAYDAGTQHGATQGARWPP